MIGQKISHYEILEKLGSGGMGSVYKANDLKLDRFVAIKFLNKELLTNKESHQRFINEAKTVSSLDHPNIAVVHEIDEFEDSIFICMGFYEGQTLQDIISQGPLPLADVYSLAIQIARGLAEAHKAGVVHRDVKPANIMVTKSGQVKILDFGLSKAINLTELTRQDSILGTAAYMSPEQIQGKQLDHLTDIFSFGIMLYEMTTGDRPFAGEYGAAVSYSIMHEEPPPLNEVRPEAPDELEKIITRVLAKDEKERYQSASEIAEALKAIRDGTSVDIPPPKKRMTFPFRIRPLVIGGILFLALATVLAFIFSRSEESRTGISIAVMPLEISVEGDIGDWKWLGDAVTELINTNLAQHSVFTMVSQKQRDEIIQKLAIPNSRLGRSEMTRFGQQAKADNLLSVTLQKTGDALTLKAQLAETKLGTVTNEFVPVQGNLNKLHELVDRLSEQIREQLEFDKSANTRSRGVASLTTSSLDAFRYFTEGRDAALDRRFEEGRVELMRAINLDSTFIQPYYYLAWLYQAIGEDVKAKGVLSKGKPYVVNLPEIERLRYLLMDASVDHRWKDYAVYLERMLQLKPSSASYHYLYGRTQFTYFRQVDDGIAAMERALQLDPNYNRAFKDLSYAYLAKGQTQKALEMIKKFAQANPTDYKPLSFMAEIQALIGQYDQGIANCERILMMRPDFQDAFLYRSQAFLAQGRVSLALQDLEQYLQLATTNYFRSNAHVYLSAVYLLIGELEKALEHVNLALESDSREEEALWLKGRILLRLGEREAALVATQQLKQILTKEDGLYYMWFWYHLEGNLALFDQNYSAAIASLEKALNLSPSPRGFFLAALGDAFAQSGQLTKAVQQYKAALLFNPNDAKTIFRLAIAYEQLNEITNSRNAYSEVLDIWSNADKGIAEIAIAKKKIATLQ